MGKRNFWDVLAWVVLFLIVLWLILKVMGIIQTPILIEYAPYFGAAYLAGWTMNRFETLCRDFSKFKVATVDEIKGIKLNCAKNHN